MFPHTGADHKKKLQVAQTDKIKINLIVLVNISRLAITNLFL